MTEKDDEKNALDALRSFAGLIALNLSLEQRLTEIVAKVSQASWESTFTRFPSWFDFYFTLPLESLERTCQLKSVQESAIPLSPMLDRLWSIEAFDSLGLSRCVAQLLSPIYRRYGASCPIACS